MQAQEKSPVHKDALLWTSIGSKAKISKRWQVNAELAYRLKDNWQTPNTMFAEVGLKWSKKIWSISGNYRAIESFSRKETRYFVDATVALISSKRWDVDVRSRTQFSTFSDRQWMETYTRQKCKTSYNIKGFPLVAVVDLELFLNTTPGFMFYDAVRWSVGFDVDVMDNLEFGVLYRFEQEFNVNNPVQGNMLVLSLKHDFGKLYK